MVFCYTSTNIWGGGPTPFLPMEKCVFSHFSHGEKSIWKEREKYSFPSLSKYFFPHFSPWGKMGKKVYGKRGKSIHFPLFPYTFFPIFSHGKKWEKTHFSMGKNGVGPPNICRMNTVHTPHIAYNVCVSCIIYTLYI